MLQMSLNRHTDPVHLHGGVERVGNGDFVIVGHHRPVGVFHMLVYLKIQHAVC